MIFNDVIVRTINNLVDLGSGITQKLETEVIVYSWVQNDVKKKFDINIVRIRFILLKLLENKTC